MKLHEITRYKLKSQPKMLETREEIEAWLKRNYHEALFREPSLIKINPDLTLDVNGDMSLPEWALGRKGKKYFIPLRLGKVTRTFIIPSVVAQSGASVTLNSLHGSPSFVGEHCQCSNIGLRTLEGAPEVVGKSALFSHNRIKEITGCPRHIGRQLDLSNNEITSLQGIHKIVDYIGDTILLYGNPIRSHVLGLLRINELKNVLVHRGTIPKLRRAAIIINKHLEGNRNIHECQEELIEAGLGEYARL